jgi:hypothetical protein
MQQASFQDPVTAAAMTLSRLQNEHKYLIFTQNSEIQIKY